MSTISARRKPGYKRTRKAREVAVPVAFNVYDSRVWGSAGDGIRVVFYDRMGDGEEDRHIATSVTLFELNDVESLKGVDAWYTAADLPRRIRRALLAEFPTWLKGVI